MKNRLGAMLMLISLAGGVALCAGQEKAPQQSAATGAAVPADDEKAPQGDRLFHEKGCSYCHGPDFAGTAKGPSLQAIGSKWDKSKIERQIREGGDSMPAFGEALTPEEVSSLVDLLASKRSAAASKPARKRGKGN